MSKMTVSLTALVPAAIALAAGGPINLTALDLRDWTVSEGPQTWAGASVTERIGALADLHRGFGLIDTQRALLHRGEAGLEVFVFTYDSTANAFGAYSVLRRVGLPAGAESVELGDEAGFHAEGMLLVWVGRCNVVVRAAGPLSPSLPDFLAVAAPLVAQVKGFAQKPELVRALPFEGQYERSVLYAHYRQALDKAFPLNEGNVLGLGDDVSVPSPVEAVYARYELAGRDQDLVAVRYPEAAAAAEAAQRFGALQAPGAKADTTTGFWRDLELTGRKHTLIYQSERLLVIAPAAAALPAVKALVAELVQALNPQPMPGGG